MQDLLTTELLENRVNHYLIVLGIIVSAYAFRRFAGRYFTNLLYVIFRRIGWKVDAVIFETLVLGPTISFFFLLISYLAVSGLHFPEVLRFSIFRTDTQGVLDSLASAIVVMAFFRMLLRGVDYIASEMEKRADQTPDKTDNQLVVFSRDFLKVLLFIIGLLALLRLAFDQDITKILAGLSLVGAAIALAARESLENLIASFIIFFDKPFTVGDVLKTGTITGTVERIGLRSTRIRTTERTYVTVPNKQMVDVWVDNLSKRTHRRVELKLELDISTHASTVQKLTEDLGILLEGFSLKESQVYISDISPDAYVVILEYYTDAVPMEEFNRLRHEVNISVMAKTGEAGIRMAGVDKERRR